MVSIKTAHALYRDNGPLILCSIICVHSATRHNIHMYPYFLSNQTHFHIKGLARLVLSSEAQGKTEMLRGFLHPPLDISLKKYYKSLLLRTIGPHTVNKF